MTAKQDGMETTDRYASLRLDNQLCFPLYACAREVVKLYKPALDELGLTYTQYIAMMVLWETPCITSKQMGERLYLDSGTLTPVLKRLEEKGWITRKRSPEDARDLLVELTAEGQALRERALSVPPQIGACIRLEPEEAFTLYSLLYKLLNSIGED